MSEVKSADWTRLTHFLEARFPELREEQKQKQTVGGF